MSDVEKTTSDIEKITSDLIFPSCNTLKDKSLWRKPSLDIFLYKSARYAFPAMFADFPATTRQDISLNYRELSFFLLNLH